MSNLDNLNVILFAIGGSLLIFAAILLLNEEIFILGILSFIGGLMCMGIIQLIEIKNALEKIHWRI